MKLSPLVFVLLSATFSSSAFSGAVYWSLFNEELENAGGSVYVTYDTLADMLNDTNRAGGFSPDGGFAQRNVVGSGSDGRVYWSLFNEELENVGSSVYVTYNALTDMLNDTSRTGEFVPDGGLAQRNVVGSGSDGSVYWSLFNEELENAGSSVYVTYDTLADMLNDTNRTGGFSPDGGFAQRNVVGSGSDGSVYWSLFNEELENVGSSVYVTYNTLADMLNDTNRTGEFVPDGGLAQRNVVGSGAFFVTDEPPATVPEPSMMALLLSGLGVLGIARIRGKARSTFNSLSARTFVRQRTDCSSRPHQGAGLQALVRNTAGDA